MFASGEYAWNSGMFIWKVSVILDEFKRQMPEFYEQLAQLETTIGTPEYESTLQRIWPLAPAQTIDYGIMEGARFTAVIPVEFGWTDVGSWASLSELLPADQRWQHLYRSHIWRSIRRIRWYSASKRLVATIGITRHGDCRYGGCPAGVSQRTGAGGSQIVELLKRKIARQQWITQSGVMHDFTQNHVETQSKAMVGYDQHPGNAR